MSIFAFVLKNWRLFALIGAALAVLLYFRHYGDARYAAGRAAEKAVWVPVQIAAEKALAQANAKNATLEAAQTAISTAAEARYADQIQTLSQRAVGADQRIAGLLRKLSTVNSCRQQLPEVAGGEPGDAGAAESDGRFAKAGNDLGTLASDCASDAARLNFWIGWYREQSALMAVTPQ